MKNWLILLPAILFPFLSCAQEQVPLLKGKVNISITQGTIDAEVSLVNMPRIKDYLIFLNGGLNLRYIKNLRVDYSYAYEREYADSVSYEAFGYFIKGSKEKYIADSLGFSYTGKFPVITDTLNAQRQDWKGNIAFNGYSVRADGYQSAWYPVLYDIKNDKMYDEVQCDLQVICNDCSAIYINGQEPVQGTHARFKADKATELMLFAGNYRVWNIDNTYFLNPDITVGQMAEFGEMTGLFKKYYEKNLGIPYTSSITYIQTTPTSKYNAWMFVSYPTIVNIGRDEYGMKKFFKPGNDWVKPYLAHELGHYYFGRYRLFNASMGDMMREGFSEYLSLKATKKFFADSIYKAKIKKIAENLKDFEPIPFGKIASAKNYNDRELYVYNYTPLILLAIEKELGMKTMWKWMRAILETKTEFTDYKFLEQTLSSILKDDEKLQELRDKYFYSGNSIAVAKSTLAIK